MSARKTIKNKKQSSAIDKPYLTKRILITAANAGIRRAAIETMDIMGYTIIANNSWVVKKYADGRIEKISKINIPKKAAKIASK